MVSRRKKSKKKKKRISKRLSKGDNIIFILTALMIVFGAMMIFDASMYIADQVFLDRFHFLSLHLIWLVLGSGVAAVIYFWDYHKILKLAAPSLVIVVILLISVLLLGEEINGSRRWFSLGGIINIQPAELA